ncbi:magnesium transporter [Singulisphaera sp. PoT]|uniref:magnesium transporter n=1 Tax=Singulisphaera sp. PoT TaxID=3411797 RepID=UPI003BF614B2
MIEKLALPEIRELIEAKDFGTLREVINRWLPADLAGLVSGLSDAHQVEIFKALVGPLASEVFEYLDLATQEQILEALPDLEGAALLEEMSADDRTALFEELPDEVAERYIDQLSPEQRVVARALLQYGESSVGRLMTPDFVAVRKEWTVKRVLDHIRAHGKDRETLNVIYVVDEDHKLIDDLRIRELLVAPLHISVKDLFDGQVIALKATDDKQTAVGVFRKYDRTALPVTDARGILVGIVTIDDVLDVAEERATREIQQFGGVEALDEPYVETPFWSLVRKRASWLIVLFLGEMLTATAMGHFEEELKRAVVLAFFVPLIISSGGNSGSQAATLIIRAIALGEVRLRDWLMVLRRELASGLMLGTILGTIGFARIAIWSQFSSIYGAHWPLIGLTVALSLVGIVLWGTLSGAMLPFILKRLGLDPATSSAPFVATLVDVTGLIIYFTVASVVLRGALL